MAPLQALYRMSCARCLCCANLRQFYKCFCLSACAVRAWQVVRGADVVQAVERAKTDRSDKPVDDIKIVNIETRASID